jgi:D-3-phosphoglycerate dehydrogenase / 2-oxoglutarate reductase
MSKVLITTVPFGDKYRTPLESLEQAGIEYLINPYNRKLTESELVELVAGFDVIIAGTEPITERVMENGANLKLISRVGIGLDNVDLLAAKNRGIRVSYTPESPAPAVAELTIGLVFSLIRSVHTCNLQMHRGEWQRFFGRRISEVTCGVIGVGRIGGRVIQHLQSFHPKAILANDLRWDLDQRLSTGVVWASKEEIYRDADIISIHVPLTPETRNMISKAELFAMKEDALIVNTARGGIVNESDLNDVLQSGHLAGAAIDVFTNEPYHGPLSQLDRCLLTSHMGSMSVDCRTQMEIEATAEAVRFLTDRTLESEVPPEEYDVQRQGLGA